MGKYKVLRFFTNLFAVFFLIGGIAYVALTNSQEAASEKNVFAILGTISFVLFIVCIVVSKKLKKKIRQPLLEAQQKILDDHNALFCTTLIHTNGLPVAHGVFTDCYWCRDKVLFEVAGASFNLEFSKLTDVSIKTDVKTQTQYVSDAGAAVAGAMKFGAAGARVAGRPQEKTSTQVLQYLVFTYVDNNAVKYIAMECAYLPKAKQFVDAFQAIKPSTTQSFDL